MTSRLLRSAVLVAIIGMPPVAVVTANPITYQSDITLIACGQQHYSDEMPGVEPPGMRNCAVIAPCLERSPDRGRRP
jgi:hypothetical protein